MSETDNLDFVTERRSHKKKKKAKLASDAAVSDFACQFVEKRAVTNVRSQKSEITHYSMLKV